MKERTTILDGFILIMAVVGTVWTVAFMILIAISISAGECHPMLCTHV